MINRFEAVGIFVSVAAMATALFLMNLSDATQSLSPDTQTAASVVLTDESAIEQLDGAMSADGTVESLIIDDVVVGSGEAVTEGDTVVVHYIGTLQNGQAFDNSYLKGEPFTFTLGGGKVIPGWEEGIEGMKVGGQRIIVIPAELAYGNRQVGPIPANSTLVFAIELLEIEE